MFFFTFLISFSKILCITAAISACTGNSTSEAITCAAAKETYTKAVEATNVGGIAGQILNSVSSVSGVDPTKAAKDAFDLAVKDFKTCTCSVSGAFNLIFSAFTVTAVLFFSL